MRLYRAGAAGISAGDGSISTSSPLAVTVSSAAAAKLSLGAASTTPTAGAADNLTLTALDSYGNTAAAYSGSHAITFSGAAASPAGNSPTVSNSSGTAVAFGSPTALNFSSGVATVSGASNGVMRLYRAGAAGISAGDGSISTSSPLAVTVAPGPASNLSFAGLTVSAGIIGSPCALTCTVTGIGNEGTIAASVAVTDNAGNSVSNLGAGHAVSVTSSGGTISGSPLTIAATGAAVSTSQFTYKSKAKGGFSDTITAATSAGTAYASATLTALR
jgi:hypothetical protein